MSYFISSMAAPGLMLMPPASKVTPLPTSTIGLAFFGPFMYSMTISLAGWLEPWDTPSSAPMPSASMSASSSTLVLTVFARSDSDCACSAR